MRAEFLSCVVGLFTLAISTSTAAQAPTTPPVPTGPPGGGGFAGPAAATGSGLEYGWDYPGYDYKNLPLAEATPELCGEACLGDADCRAFTYVQPGIRGPKAHCFLKYKVDVSKKRRDSCCVSGLKPQTGPPKGGRVTGPAAPLVPASAALQTLTGKQIASAFTGKTIRWVKSGEDAADIQYQANGNLLGFVRARGLSDKGKWWLEGNNYCRQWSQWRGGSRQCFSIKSDRQGLKIYQLDGSPTGYVGRVQPPLPR